MQVVQAAATSGEWTYSQGDVKNGEPAVDYAARVGDCTDYSRNATDAGLGDSWAGQGSEKANTYMFKKGEAQGYALVEQSAAQPGDIVVQGGHAGVFTGINDKGEIRALANNGTPAKSQTGYYDGKTQVTTFRNNEFGPGRVLFFREVVK